MSIFGSLFGNNTSTTTSQQQLAPQAASAASDLFNRATAYAAQPYAPYTGDRVAGFTPEQLQAFQNTQNLAGSSANIFNTLQNTITGPNGLAQRFTDIDMGSYMNPYVNQVLAPAIEDLQRQGDANRNRLAAQAVRTGSFGGSRNAIAMGENDANTLREIGRLSANERARAFNEGASQFRMDQERIPGLLGALNTANTARFASEVNPLLATGGLQQALQQANLDTDYQNFLEQRDWGARGINTLMQALGTGGTLGSTTRGTLQSPTGNPLGQVIGATTGLIGSLGGLGSIGGALSSAWDSISGWLGGSSGGGGLDYSSGWDLWNSGNSDFLM